MATLPLLEPAKPEAACTLGRAPRALKAALRSFGGQKVPMGGLNPGGADEASREEAKSLKFKRKG